MIGGMAHTQLQHDLSRAELRLWLCLQCLITAFVISAMMMIMVIHDVGDDGESESERESESHALTRAGWCLGGVGVWALDFPNV